MRLVVGVVEVGAATGFDNRNIRRHDFVFGMCLAQNLGAARAVVVVAVADEQDLDIAEVEAQGLDALAYLRRR